METGISSTPPPPPTVPMTGPSSSAMSHLRDRVDLARVEIQYRVAVVRRSGCRPRPLPIPQPHRRTSIHMRHVSLTGESSLLIRRHRLIDVGSVVHIAKTNLSGGVRVPVVGFTAQRILNTRHLPNRMIMRRRRIGGRLTVDLAPRMRMPPVRLIPEGITETDDRVHRLLMRERLTSVSEPRIVRLHPTTNRIHDRRREIRVIAQRG